MKKRSPVAVKQRGFCLFYYCLLIVIAVAFLGDVVQ